MQRFKQNIQSTTFIITSKAVAIKPKNSLLDFCKISGAWFWQEQARFSLTKQAQRSFFSKTNMPS